MNCPIEVISTEEQVDDASVTTIERYGRWEDAVPKYPRLEVLENRPEFVDSIEAQNGPLTDEEFKGLVADYRDRVANKMMDGDPEYNVDEAPELHEIGARSAHTRTAEALSFGASALVGKRR